MYPYLYATSSLMMIAGLRNKLVSSASGFSGMKGKKKRGYMLRHARQLA